MKNIKDITISIFAIIGFVFILSSFNKESVPQETHSTVPESHAWELVASNATNNRDSEIFSINKVTGEVRKHSTQSVYIYDDKLKDYKENPISGYYRVMTER